MPRLSLGLDVGGTNIKVALLHPTGGIAKRTRWKTASFGDVPDQIQQNLESHIRAFLQSAGLRDRDLRALGVASAGLVNSETGRLEDVPNIVTWEGMELGPWLAERFACPVRLENDVNALVYGEWRRGAGRGTRNLLGLALGTGVGGGLILDGELYTGHKGLGAELGHITIERNGRRCACGNRGCVEAYAGAGSITRAARRALARKRPGHSRLAAHLRGADPTPARLSAAAKAGVPLARELYAAAGRALGVAIASYVNIFAPERVLIAGGVSRAGRLLLDPAREEAKARVMSIEAQLIDIRLRSLGDDGAAIGAALLAERAHE